MVLFGHPWQASEYKQVQDRNEFHRAAVCIVWTHVHIFQNNCRCYDHLKEYRLGFPASFGKGDIVSHMPNSILEESYTWCLLSSWCLSEFLFLPFRLFQPSLMHPHQQLRVSGKMKAGITGREGKAWCPLYRNVTLCPDMDPLWVFPESCP